MGSELSTSCEQSPPEALMGGQAFKRTMTSDDGEVKEEGREGHIS
jgi:hypothetical protein